MKFRILSLILPLTLAGCIAVDCGYTPNEEIVQGTPIPLEKRIPVTFSVDLECPLIEPPTFGPTQEELRKRIEQALKDTGLFSEVRYTSSVSETTYHISFSFHVGGASQESETVAGTLAGVSLCLVPVWTWSTFDGCAETHLRGKIIHSSGAAEKLFLPIWLPLAPVGLFWNCAVGWNSTEKGVINAIINDFATFHRTHFLNK